MYQENRLRELLRLIGERGEVSTKEMMDYFDVSRDTIRRDFVILADEGKAIRTHGGMTRLMSEREIYPLSARVNESSRAKEQIAKRAKGFLESGGTYFFDVSTITLKLAQLITKKMTVYTHSLDIANTLGGNPLVDLKLLGGTFFPKNRFFYSLIEAEMLDNVHFDAVFIGAAGLKNGFVNFEDQEDAHLKHLAMEHAKSKILLAEHTKFKKTATYGIGKISDFDYFITDVRPNKEDLRKFEQGVELLI